MVRLIANLIGAVFVFVLAIALFGTVKEAFENPAPATAEHEFHQHPEDIGLPSAGLFGKYNQQQLQRGFKVFQEVCAACHSLKYVAFRDLQSIGYSEGQVKAIALAWPIEQPSVNPETGEAATRKNLPSDHFPSPYANEVAARAANNNALPPDLSLITKARHDGANYVHALLMGYRDPATFKNERGELLKTKFPEFTTPPGLNFNPWFANLNLAMPQPLASDGQVTYDDGTKSTMNQMSTDVAAFLAWTAEPRLEARHSAGFAAAIFLLIFCFLAWGAYQNVWRDVKH